MYLSISILQRAFSFNDKKVDSLCTECQTYTQNPDAPVVVQLFEVTPTRRKDPYSQNHDTQNHDAPVIPISYINQPVFCNAQVYGKLLLLALHFGSPHFNTSLCNILLRK